MADKIPLQVFLSYRSHWTDKLAQLQREVTTYNGQPDSVYLIELKVSESELHEGDSITGFMETMATARFVILMPGGCFPTNKYIFY